MFVRVVMAMTVLMIAAVFVIMTVLMNVAVFVIVAVTMFVAVFVIVAMLVTVPSIVSVTMLMFLSVTMLMFLPRLQMHVKIKRIQPARLLPSEVQMIPLQTHAVQGFFQHFTIRAQIQKRPHRHIPADSRITFQIKYFSHIISPPVCLFASPHIRRRIRCQYLLPRFRSHRN